MSVRERIRLSWNLLLLTGICWGLTAAQGPAWLECTSGIPGVLPANFFERFAEFRSVYGRDSLQRSQEFLYTIYLPKLSSAVETAIEVCPAPVLELLMDCILALDADYSLAEAQQVYVETVGMAARKVKDPNVQQVVQSWRKDAVYTYPLLMGLEKRSCYGTNVKIFVYDVPEYLIRSPLRCAVGQWGTEVFFHRFLLSAECRTKDPEEADFFFVPIYNTCVGRDHGFNTAEEGEANVWDFVMDLLHSMPWATRRSMRDHIFLFADGTSARSWEAYNLIRSEAIFFMVEAKCPTWDEPARRYLDVLSCGSGWKDVIIPGHTDHNRAQRMLEFNLPLEERDLLMTFHGRHPESHEVYGNCTVRQDIMKLADLPGVDVGGFIEDYLERKGRSRFCLVPGGTSPWTNHLYESFFSGCIPVILSDEYEVAFQETIDWPKMTIKWPESEVNERLYDHLNSIPEETLRRMKAEIDRHACWFDYSLSLSSSTDRETACSPYFAAFLSLERLLERRPKSHGRFWNAESVLPQGKVGMPPKRTTLFHIYGNESFRLFP